MNNAPYFKKHCPHYLVKLFLVTIVLIISVPTIECSGWNLKNNPRKIVEQYGKEMVVNLDHLPLKARISQLPWSDSYWPSNKRGIAYRWQGDLTIQTKRNFLGIAKKKSKNFTLKELLAMSEDEINKLSPAEKIDVLNGNYNYPITAAERSRTNKDDLEWEGLCNGFATASARLQEPGTCKIKTADGVIIPFQSSDIKAALILLNALNNPNPSIQCGLRKSKNQCFIDAVNELFDKENSDINAGAFHLAITNLTGIQDKSFNFDVDNSPEVWNHPVEGYTITSLEGPLPPVVNKAARGTAHEYHVNIKVIFTGEIDTPMVLPQNGGELDRFANADNDNDKGIRKVKLLSYILEVDKRKNIIGGRWINKDRPEFIWTQREANFTEDFKKMEDVYRESLESACLREAPTSLRHR